MVILEASRLVFHYPGGIAALDGLDLAVQAGETLAILGPNGAGKTTLLLHLNGSLRPATGMIRLEGLPVAYDRAALIHWRTTVGLVLQDPDDQLFAGSVFEDVSFGPLNLGLAEAEVRARAAAALADLEVTELADRPIHMLSLGQKRRVAIAGVLAMRPRVLLLDEPTAGLDPQGQGRLVETLSRLAAAGTTILYATHDVDLAYAWSDRVALFANGRMIGCDAPARSLADDAQLRAAHLRRPLVLEISERARMLGLLDAQGPVPRTAAELAEALARGSAGAAEVHRTARIRER